VFQLPINAPHGMLQEPALLVIKVMKSLKVNAFNQLFNNQPIWDVKLGIGTDKFVSNVLPDGPSTQREFVFQSLTTVIHGMLQEPALLVIMDMS
jgi:hypothetical protein